MQTPPGPVGLYDPRFEHDSCGVSFVAHIKGVASHDLVRTGLVALTNLEHRGATGAEPDTGDGAGILTQIPDRFLRSVLAEDQGITLPPVGSYAVGVAFLPADAVATEKAEAAIEAIVAEEGMTLIAWRDLPTDPSTLGATARAAMPTFRQLFISDPGGASGIALDRKAYLVRKRIEHELDDETTTYCASLSSRTLVHKGMLTTPQLTAFFPDLSDERFESALLLVHSRFSTNTFPSWPLAHPYRFVAHNGEINTVQGNENWMRAREAMLHSPDLPQIERAFPICTPGASDTARFDEVLELLHLGGRPIEHAVLMMIPEAWENNDTMDPARRAFYRFHSSIMEPWDGPASVTFTDGTVIGAVLDRNGLRPSRYWVTDDDIVVMASEVGVMDVAPEKIVAKGRLQPGRMFLIDTAEGRIVGDDEIKDRLAAEHPYAQWLEEGLVEFADLPAKEHVVFSHDSVLRRQQMFGYTHEELKIILAPMAIAGAEPLGSMGTDTPIAVLSARPRLLFDYFSQLFAQVTNPPLDAIREEVVTSVASTVGPEANLLDPGPESCRQLALPFPIIDNDELAKIVHAGDGGYPGSPQPRGHRSVPGLRRRTGVGAGTVGDLLRGVARHRRRRPDHRVVGSQRRSRQRADPVAPADGGGAPPPGADQAAHAVRPGGRVRRRPRGAPHGAPGRVRGRCRQPVFGLRVDRGPDCGRRGHRAPRPRWQGSPPGRPQLHQGVRQGRAEGHVQDGRVDGGELHRCPDLRGHRARSRAGRPLLHGHRQPPGWGRAGAAGGRGGRSPHRRPPRASRGAGPPHPGARGRVPVAARGRGAPLQPGNGLQAAARHPGQALRHLQAVHRARRRPVRAARHVAGPVRLQGRRADAGTDRRGRIGVVARAALLDRGDELRLDLGRGPRDAGGGDEPAGRQVEHR